MQMNDNPLSQKRYLRRPWKLFKPHLPCSDSLPDLALIPHERPLFTCRNCNFSNTLVDLCLWCPLFVKLGPIQTENPEKESRRRRRVSAPAFMLCWQPTTHTRHRSRILPTAVSTLHRKHSLPRVDEDGHGDNANSKWCETAADKECHVTSQLPSYPLPSRSALSRQLDQGVLPHRSTSSGGAVLRAERELSSCCCVDRSGMLGMNTGVDNAFKSPMNLTRNDRMGRSASSDIDKGHTTIPSTPPLRRKKSHFVLHMSAPPSNGTVSIPVSSPVRQRPQSQPAFSHLTGADSASSPMRMPITDLNQHLRARAQTRPELLHLQLGHPHRPYYTALRKDMTPPPGPSSVVFDSTLSNYPLPAAIPSSSSPNPSRASSPAFYYPYPASFSDDSHELSSVELAQFSHYSSGVTPSFTPFGLVFPSPPTETPASTTASSKSRFSFSSLKGKLRRNSDPMMFSKSDEINLRLALAKEVGGTDVKVDEGYVYQGKAMVNIRLHVRRWSRGLKDLVTVKRRR